MKKLPIILVVFYLCSLNYEAISQSYWENINFPENIKSDISSLAVKGSDIYVGTGSNGLWYTSDNGTKWDKVDNWIGTEKVNEILFDINSVVYVSAGMNNFSRLFRGAWQKISYFKELNQPVNCMASGLGTIYIGTDNAVYKSLTGGGNNLLLDNSTKNLAITKVHAIGVNSKGNVFISIEGEVTGFQRSTDNGDNWKGINKGLPDKSIAKKFLFDKDDNVYAVIESSIYLSRDNGDNWVLMPKGFEIIRLAEISGYNLIIFDGKRFYLYDKINDSWIIGDDNLNEPDTKYIIADNDYLYAAGGKGISKTSKKISDIIKNLSVTWTIRVIDDKNQPIPNKEFDISRMVGQMQQGVGKITTDVNGKFTVSTKDFAIGNGIKIERIVHTEPAVKIQHSSVDNIKYRVKVDNVQFDAQSNWVFNILSVSEQNIDVKLNHTTILLHLIYSVEWDSKPDYLDSLTIWLKRMNNYIYNITDGQMYIEKAAIFDDKAIWRYSDVHFYANNMVWPNAWVGGIHSGAGTHAHLPRLWQGNGDDSRNISSKSDWLKYDNDHWRTLSHELGHYAMSFWDEYVYVDTNAAKYLPAGYNYGFMDYQYSNGDAWRNEMSNLKRYPSQGYKITQQWAWNGSDCWTDFEKEFENTYDGIICPIIKPSERSSLSGLDYFAGPNNGAINCDVGILLDCQVYDKISNAGYSDITCYYQYDNKLIPFPKCNVVLQKSDRKMYEGLSADDGKFRIVGAEAGDVGYLTYDDKLSFQSYIAKFNVLFVNKTEKSGNDGILENTDITLKPVSGTFPLIPSAQLNKESNLEFIIYSSGKFKNNPVLSYSLDRTPINTELVYDSKANAYKGILLQNNDDLPFIKIQDNNNEEFIIPVMLETDIASGNKVITNDGGLTIFQERFDEKVKFNILSANYPSIREGIATEEEQGGKLYSIYSTISGRFQVPMLLGLAYNRNDLSKKTPESLKIHFWDETEYKWKLLGGWVDTLHHQVFANFDRNGIYALFTYNEKNDLNENMLNPLKIRISPNPAESVFKVEIWLNNPDVIDISLSDLYGNKVAILFEGMGNPGYNSYTCDAEELPAGIYFCKIKVGSHVYTEKVVIMK